MSRSGRRKGSKGGATRRGAIRAKPDAFGKRAKKEGYPARSVFKLEEIDKKLSLFKHGQRVIDLGASPGSWSLFAARQVGKQGAVIGVDLQELRCQLPEWATFIQADIFDLPIEELGGPASFDLVISDMAPGTTGHRVLDQARSFNLYMRALNIAKTLLKPGGHFVAKIFQGPDFEEARRELRLAFKKAKIVRPEAVRKDSVETFLCGLERKAPPQESGDAAESEPKDPK